MYSRMVVAIYLSISHGYLITHIFSLSGASRVEQLRAHKAAEISSFTAAERIGAAYVLATRGLPTIEKDY